MQNLPLVISFAINLALAVICYLQWQKAARLAKNKSQSEERYLEDKNSAALLIQELQIKEHYNKERLQQLYSEYERLKTESTSMQEAMREHYEGRLQTLQDSHKLEMQERLREELELQKGRLQEEYQQRQEEVTKTLAAEREKQEALLTQRFYEISEALLSQRGQEFQEKQELSLKPLTDEILRFKQEIARNTKENQEKQTSLITEIKLLKDANLLVSKEANNLASVMKGGAKKQGQWGELVLERILESSGLQKDREYFLQHSLRAENNQNLRPDVLIQLPDNRAVVVDSKVSLTAYIDYNNCDDNAEKQRLLRSHFESIKAHVKSLSSKSYQDYTHGARLDFVIMFMPNEGAYSEILKEAPGLFVESYQKGVVLSSPTTLLVVLRLINYLWQNEARDKNMNKILDSCEKIIKKFNGLSENMLKLDRALDNARTAYQGADTQLNGRGSISSNIEELKRNMSKIAPEDSNTQPVTREESKALQA